MIGAPDDAAAQGFSLNRYEPAERGSNWFVLDHLDLQGHLRPAGGVTLDYQYRPLAVKEGLDKTLRTAVVGHVITLDAGANVVVWNRLRVGVSIPVVLYNEGEDAKLRGQTIHAPADAQGVGDLRFGVDARLFGKADAPITMAAGLRMWLPTGSPSSYTGDGFIRVGPRVAVAGQLGRFVYAGNLGVVVRDPEQGVVGEVPIDSELIHGVSVGLSLFDHRITVGPELHGSTGLGGQAFKTRASPLEALFGAHGAIVHGVRAGLGVGKGIVAGFGSPDVRALASVEWVMPYEEPVVVITTPPPPPDNDGDGIPDDQDACPDAFGPKRKDKLTSGCDDRDKDGIVDPQDACPDEVGVSHPDAKRNGCPSDKDDDGIIDKADACPDVKGVPSDDPKLNGCPDLDPDYDGILGAADACPNDPGPAHSNPKRNGCPVALLRASEIVIKESIAFEPDTAVLREDKGTIDVLSAVRDILIAHSELEKLRIEGHTDNRGKPRDSQKLSQERALAVVNWLTEQGIKPNRLSAVGMGQDRPIDSNDTDEGRAANQRIEFHVEKVAPRPAPATPAPAPPSN